MSGPQAFDWLGGGAEDAREALDQNEAMHKANEQALREQARLFYDVFAVGRGPELLEHLRARTIEFPLLLAGGTIGNIDIGLNPADWAFYREGQNSLIRYIIAQIRNAVAAEQEDVNDV